MERSEFLPGEPVLVGLSVENEGRRPFEDLAPFSVELGYLGFLLSKNGGEPGRTHSSWAAVFTHEGPRLAPGDRICDVRNLGMYFRSGALGSGSYMLKTVFRARLGVRRDLRPVEVEGNEVAFTVRDTSAISSDETAALQILQLGRAGQLPSRDRWNGIRVGLMGSGYFPEIEGLFMSSQDSVGLEQMASTCLAQGRPLTAAAILRARFDRFSDNLNVYRAWIQRMERDDREAVSACILRSWRNLVLQARRPTSPPHSPVSPAR